MEYGVGPFDSLLWAAGCIDVCHKNTTKRKAKDAKAVTQFMYCILIQNQILKLRILRLFPRQEIPLDESF